jgi:hypothetical protein
VGKKEKVWFDQFVVAALWCVYGARVIVLRRMRGSFFLFFFFPSFLPLVLPFEVDAHVTNANAAMALWHVLFFFSLFLAFFPRDTSLTTFSALVVPQGERAVSWLAAAFLRFFCVRPVPCRGGRFTRFCGDRVPCPAGRKEFVQHCAQAMLARKRCAMTILFEVCVLDPHESGEEPRSPILDPGVGSRKSTHCPPIGIGARGLARGGDDQRVACNLFLFEIVDFFLSTFSCRRPLKRANNNVSIPFVLFKN